MTTLGGIAITYDAEGNQSSTTASGQTTTYTFDAEGQRVEKQIAGGATVVDVHDAFGRLATEYIIVDPCSSAARTGPYYTPGLCGSPIG